MALFKFYSTSGYQNFLNDVYEIVKDDSENIEDDWELTAEIPDHYVDAFQEIDDRAVIYGGERVES